MAETADDRQAALDFAEACRRADEDPRERQRLRDISDLVDAEDAVYAQALAAIDRNDLSSAEPLLRGSAEAGIGDAAWLLAGVLEKLGRIQEALGWYRRAGSDGDPRADDKIAELNARPEREPRGTGGPAGSPGGVTSTAAAAGKSLLAIAALSGLFWDAAMPGDDPLGARAAIWRLGSSEVDAILAGSPPATGWQAAWYNDVFTGRWHKDPAPSMAIQVKTVKGWRVPGPVSPLSWDQGQGVRALLGRHFGDQLCDYFSDQLCDVVETMARRRVKVALLSLAAADCEPGIVPLLTPGRSGSAVREETAADTMLPLAAVPGIAPEATVYEALDQMLRSGAKSLPVIEGAEVTGVVTLAHLAQSLHEAKGTPSIQRVKTLMQPPVTVAASMPASEVMAVAARTQAGLLVVTSSDGEPTGYLTPEMILARAPGSSDDSQSRPASGSGLLLPGQHALPQAVTR
jgi:CBS domain-containing protein